jgi:phosphomannomutase
MFMCTVLEGHEYDCAVMLTASHLPPDRNGLKFFTRHGSANKGDVRAMLEDAAAAVERRGGSWLGAGVAVAVRSVDFIPVYAKHLVDLIRACCAHPADYERPLTGFKIVVDAGNGAAGFFAGLVLEPLGATVVGQFLDPDGTFPNHVPNPEDKKAMQMTIDATVAAGADLGVIFDTDVDRSGVVDGAGMGINRNALIALLARIVLREHSRSTIVTDSVTSSGLKRFIEQFGGRHYRYRKGYKNVIDKGVELNEAGVETQLAIETSGHGAMKENYFLDDGAYLAVKIIIEMVRMRLQGDARGIGGLLDDLETPREEDEFRLNFLDQSDFQAYGKRVVEAFAEFAAGVDGWTVEEVNHEGFRVNVDEGDGKSGWLLLRQSLHDPLLPLNIESEVDGGISRIAAVLVERFLPKWANVDASPLATYGK